MQCTFKAVLSEKFSSTQRAESGKKEFVDAGFQVSYSNPARVDVIDCPALE